ncbi:Glycogen phosphorylase [Venturia nashicola]|nr:Glycogen phosphorylase [Venturia nashicola]
MSEKRGPSGSFSSAQLVKRQRSDANLNHDRSVAVVNGTTQNGALIQSSPVMELKGHNGEIFATRFDPTGQFIASGSMDRSIFLWRTYGACENFGVLPGGGHKGAVLDLQWSRDSKVIYSASADQTLASWDLDTGTRIRKHLGHSEVINCMDVSKRGEELLVSASDDGYIGIWDPRQKEAVDFIETEFPVTAVALAEAGNELYSGGIDNDIKVWDMRKKAVAYALMGHTDTISSLQVSPDSQYLLSNAHDSTVRTWDIRPFAPADRAVRTYDGAPTGFEKNLFRASWDPTGKKIAAGGGDRNVAVWDIATGKLLNKLPGHKGAVNDVRFHPGGEPINPKRHAGVGASTCLRCTINVAMPPGFVLKRWQFTNRFVPTVVSGSSDRMVLVGELGK